MRNDYSPADSIAQDEANYAADMADYAVYAQSLADDCYPTNATADVTEV